MKKEPMREIGTFYTEERKTIKVVHDFNYVLHVNVL